MDKISITTGRITLPVERDGVETGSISFNPNDAIFAAKYQSLIQALNEKRVQWKESKEVGPQIMVDACNFLKDQIDEVFGQGSSEILFGDACSLEMFDGFFKGVAPVFTEARAEKIGKYIKNECSD